MSKLDTFKSCYSFDTCEYNCEIKTSMGIATKALAVCSPENEYQIIECIKAAKAAELPFFVCGNLSNTVIRDGGYNGVIIRIASNFSGYEIDNDVITVKAGMSMVKLAKELTEKGYGGLEFAGGIPGTVGGGIRMNAGAYGGQMSDVVKSVTYYDGEEIVTTTELGFGYRESVFENMDGIVILEAIMYMTKDSGDMDKLKEYNMRRKDKQPLDKPNCGSVFKRPKNGYAAQMIEECGLKGKRIGGAVVSEKHSGFIVNDNHGTAEDVLKLMEFVRQTVLEKTGTRLENEWVIIGDE